MKLEYFRNLEAKVNHPLNSLLENQKPKKQRKIMKMVRRWRREYKDREATSHDEVHRLSDTSHKYIEVLTYQNMLLALNIEKSIIIKLGGLLEVNSSILHIENLTKIKKALTPILKPTKPSKLIAEDVETDADTLNKLVNSMLDKL